MFNDEDPEEFNIEEILEAYYQIKKGFQSTIYLGTDEYTILIEYFIYQNNYPEALHAVDLGLTYYPSSIDLLNQKAELYYDKSNLAQALQCLELVEKLDPLNYNANSLKAHILHSQNKSKQAIEYLHQCIDRTIDDETKILLYTDLIDIYDDIDELEEVFHSLLKILEINPNDQETLQKMSYWADISGMTEESEKYHTEYVENNPFSIIGWYNLGSAKHTLKKYTEAEDAYENAIALDDKFEPAYRNLADVQMKMKAFDKALDTLTANLEIGNAEDVIFEAMGTCFEKKKDYKKARYYYRQAVKLRPEDDLYFYKIATTYFRENSIENAYESYLSAYKLNPENYLYSYHIGICLQMMEMHKEATAYFLKSIYIKPTAKSTWIGLFKTLYSIEMYDDIILQKEIAIENCGEKAEFEYIHVACLLALGKSKEAIERLHVAMNMSKRQFKILLDLQPDALTRKSISDVWSMYKKKK